MDYPKKKATVSSNKKLSASVEQAMTALDMELELRRERFCFANRYTVKSDIAIVLSIQISNYFASFICFPKTDKKVPVPYRSVITYYGQISPPNRWKIT